MKVGDRYYRSLWADDKLRVVHAIDQARLPYAFEVHTLTSAEAVAESIRTMRVRGAPLIGVVAAYGLAFAVAKDSSDAAIAAAARMLKATRPTAVNLAWALGRMQEKLKRVVR